MTFGSNPGRVLTPGINVSIFMQVKLIKWQSQSNVKLAKRLGTKFSDTEKLIKGAGQMVDQYRRKISSLNFEKKKIILISF